ncbi:MAG: type II toxin-antitoxin system RelE/ParE family toxin [Phycisphaerae bacterium]|nr:type II toxin-antitoxin system RelE/ParE family toxin [Phycisphaerae bacterium]
MRNARLHPQAEAEMIEAAVYYESRQADLGKRFLASVQDAINSIEINPWLFPVVDVDVRRCLTKVFPFGVLFRLSDDQVVVVAVMHLRRHPDYWKGR